MESLLVSGDVCNLIINKKSWQRLEKSNKHLPKTFSNLNLILLILKNHKNFLKEILNQSNLNENSEKKQYAIFIKKTQRSTRLFRMKLCILL